MKKQYLFTLLLLSILVIAFAATAGSGRSDNASPTPPAIGTVLDDFKLPDLNGAERSLNSLKGKNGAVLIFISVQCMFSND